MIYLKFLFYFYFNKYIKTIKELNLFFYYLRNFKFHLIHI